jgi:membrane protein YqaA with SNARE-associated domain
VGAGGRAAKEAKNGSEDSPLDELALALNLNSWKQKIIAFASGLGAPGLFLISFLDSSVLSFPIINDLLLVELAMRRPARMPLYALMAAAGSVLGCVLLYYIARAGGEAYFQRRAGRRAHAVRHWVERNGFGGVLLAALLPPPTPFKAFVFAAGAFEVPLAAFASAIALARLSRYFLVGFLSVRYGENALPYLKGHWPMLTLLAVIFAAASYGASKVILRRHPPKYEEP